MHVPLVALALGAVFWTLSTYRAFQRNRQLAIASGLPFICLPVDTFSPFWQVAGPVLVPLLRFLPFGLGAWADDARAAWVLKHELHSKYGRVFIVVCPWQNVVHVADPDVVVDVVTRRTEFPKPAHFYKIVEVYGRSVVTTDGADWVRYRKITGPPFSEKNNHLVWRSTLEQTSQFLEALKMTPIVPATASNRPGRVLPQLQRDMKTIALHIIAEAGFGVALPFAAADLENTASIHTLLRFLIPVMVIPKPLLRAIPIPAWRSAYTAYAEFQKYTALLTSRAKEDGMDNDGSRANLLHALVANAEVAGEKSERLSDAEVLAHLFVFILAGHETTANALSYAILNLAIHSDVQEWFIQRLDDELSSNRGIEPRDWGYDSVFGQAQAALCIMNETLRLFPTVAGVPKWTDSSSVALAWNERKFLVPPKTPVVFNTIAMHRDPTLWGPDAAEFKPQRWLKDQPRKGQFMAFSEGARACLGKKFAQVEFVAVLATIFSRFRAELECAPGQTMDDAKKKAMAAFDSSVVLATLGMTKQVPVRFVPR
ncbi:cytochrome P450 [Exidia glandulosa HHB12029]|uniref:Cytochrome P450 n=1 Tax=Exidia glandulosa HHB12029 TaxID=1314781 RepID=A0A165LMH9_EXIGL|nr:cytochrome P450 [Exidia glandulosa HHB12029]